MYRHWRGVFYPERLPAADWLPYYARHFDTVEMNATFYRLPSPAAVDAWRGRVGPRFRFACKGSRFLTHMKRLLDTTRGVERYYSPVRRLGSTLEVVLWQLPPHLPPDLPRLDAFLSGLPEGVRSAVEFRHDGWYTEATCALLRSPRLDRSMI